MARAGIALGSNLGERLSQLRGAITGLREIAAPGEPVLVAAIYQTEPRHCPPGSRDFLNTVIEIGFMGGPLDLLAHTRTLEEVLGRVRSSMRNAPRVIDIDLLYLGSVCCNSRLLVLPHPRISQRRFVLQPLADIRPDLILPGQPLTVTEMLATLPPGEPPLLRVEEIQ